jgi:hypothetical protein
MNKFKVGDIVETIVTGYLPFAALIEVIKVINSDTLQVVCYHHDGLGETININANNVRVKKTITKKDIFEDFYNNEIN